MRGKEHPDYANSLDLLAGLYQKMGNYGKAEPLFLENKDIVEKVMEKNHPDYAACLQNLGALLGSMGNFEKSEMFYLEAQSIFEKCSARSIPSMQIVCTVLQSFIEIWVN
ncbi:MAG: tetratricopeptide repeat protein [Saprospiraceae bacterium]|nr:tetratricopeptide repeat protein [Candidatus Vicinibacter affinis]